MSKTKIIAIANQKGGVGKTTTAVNLATAFAAVGRTTLLIDLDPQGNASTGLGVDADNRTPNTYDMILGEATILECEKPCEIPGLTILPAIMDLSAADLEIASMENREFLLKNQIERCTKNYDFIIIDCPPSLGLLTVNALTAATHIIIPLQCEFFALEGLSYLLNTIELVQNNLNPGLKIGGIALTMYDKRNRITQEVEKDVRKHLGALVFKSTIPRNVKLSEAPSHGKPAIIYDHRCSGSEAYLLLAREALKKIV
jgi:chromosome partitioning protein